MLEAGVRANDHKVPLQVLGYGGRLELQGVLESARRPRHLLHEWTEERMEEDRKTDMQRQTDRKADRNREAPAGRQTDRKTGRQTERQADRQKDRQTARQTDEAVEEGREGEK